MTRPSVTSRVASRARTVVELIQHLLGRRQYFLIPLLLVLLLAGLLLLLTEGASYLTPFVYTLF